MFSEQIKTTRKWVIMKTYSFKKCNMFPQVCLTNQFCTKYKNIFLKEGKCFHHISCNIHSLKWSIYKILITTIEIFKESPYNCQVSFLMG